MRMATVRFTRRRLDQARASAELRSPTYLPDPRSGSVVSPFPTAPGLGFAENFSSDYSATIDLWTRGVTVRWVIGNMLVAVMLLHAMLGCGMHHSHAGDSVNVLTHCPAPLEQFSGRDAHGHDPDHDLHPGHDPGHGVDRECGPVGPHPHPDGPCQEEKCTFLRPAQDQVDVKAAPPSLDSVAWPDCSLVSRSVAGEWFPGPGAVLLQLSVRSHLAKRVLVI